MNRDLMILVALGAIAAYFITRKAGAVTFTDSPGYEVVNPQTGLPYYPEGTLDETYL